MELIFADVQHAYMRNKRQPPTKQPPFRVTKIRKWREDRDKTLEEVAEVLGITHATLSRIERGWLPYQQEHLERLSRVLKVDIPSLLYRDPQDAETIWPSWLEASSDQKQMIVDIAKSIVKPR